MLTPAQALERIFALLPPAGTEEVALRQAAGRVLARAVEATRDQPPFAASAMDGYAVQSADIATGAALAVIGQSQAGTAFAGAVGQGQAVRIFTGAPVPDSADRVLIQEDAARKGDTITVQPGFDLARHIRAQGSDFARGAVFQAPKRLSPADIGMLAAMNIGRISVSRKPVVALIATGDELVNPGETPGPWQIVASNGHALAALLELQGAVVRLLPIARDSSESLRVAFAFTSGADLIVTIGGASVGDHDLVQETAVALGLQVDFWKIAMRPGKPFIAGKMGATPFLGLPGNPVSALVCGHIFLRPAIDSMLGLPAQALPRLRGILAEPTQANGNREHYLRATATPTDGGWQLTPAQRQDSSQLSVLAAANALIVAAPGQPALPPGSRVEFMPI